MRKKRAVELRNLYQNYLNKKREETGEEQVFNKGEFRRVKAHWKKYKEIY